MSITHAPSPDALFTARFLARVPPDVAASFTPAQLRAVQASFGMRYAMDHAIDLRRRVRLPWLGGVYVVLLAGRDGRDGCRGDGRGRRRWPMSRGIRAVVACGMLLALAALPAGALLLPG
ncbi:hypothetical protein [Acidisphaera rubrifaciens]|uniref:Uncharacterized protein n=1 Tax=Acidisphaera rubrifaciens HS-AP3 TaxID=1231350 RepID=A0A0D6P9R4_9PROT|nr:hypothetical protein [Acidisphaera rubrifaciens]GAN78397.1 hypothetical protein Asru_0815_02 [Acidisphaera rubrifaciens HS-AP3]